MLGILKTLLPHQMRIRIVNYLYSSPLCTRKSRIYNGLGGNIFRLIGFQLFYLLRNHKVKLNTKHEPLVKKLKQDGIVCIEDFLSREEFAAVLEEYESNYDQFHISPTLKYPVQKRYALDKNRIEESKSLQKRGPVLKKLLVNRESIEYLVQRYTKRKFGLSPSVLYGEEYYPESDLGKKSDSNSVMTHYDVPYHSLKIFYYINDVNESNGAFHYSYGSHRFNWRRLFLEYFTANNIAARRRPWVNFADCSLLEHYEKNLKPVVGKANTLFIFDAMGIHKRGAFSTTKPRRTAQISYRMLDSWANTYSNFINRLIRS